VSRQLSAKKAVATRTSPRPKMPRAASQLTLSPLRSFATGSRRTKSPSSTKQHGSAATSKPPATPKCMYSYIQVTHWRTSATSPERDVDDNPDEPHLMPEQAPALPCTPWDVAIIFDSVL